MNVNRREDVYPKGIGVLGKVVERKHQINRLWLRHGEDLLCLGSRGITFLHGCRRHSNKKTERGIALQLGGSTVCGGRLSPSCLA